MEVHNNLGSGFLEIVYKDASQYEFHADFVVYGKIILEVKAVSEIYDKSIAQALNYLSFS